MSFLQKDVKEIELKNQNIVVAVRCRPRNDMEKSMNSPVCIECFPERKEIVYRSDKATSYEHEKKFSFDRVFGPNTRQIEVYKGVVAPLISEVLMGYSCTVFAYGQTGTGKTFTMEGERSSNEYTWEKDPLTGIIPRCVHQLFEELHKSRDIVDFSVRVSFLEIYNEELYDLLGGVAENAIRPRMYEDSSRKGSVIISGMEEVLVKDKEQVFNILQKGAERRQFASTLMNAHSSRSHTVFSVVITMKENSLDGEDLLKTGKLYLVDLAGSENIGRSGAIDRRAREAGTINQSLLTLGRVINALLERKPHIPYRESKLTRLLQDSLGGKTKTCIIATISPATYNIEETLSTLEYAHRAKKIKNRPEINQKLTQRGLIREYTENIAKLKADLAAAREKNGVYLTEERYTQMKGSIQVHKEMIAELEANLKAASDEFEQLNHMFSETQQQLYRKSLDVDNSRKWMDHLRNELLSSIEKINDKSLKLAEYNFTIKTFEDTLGKLYNDASLLKSQLDDTTSNAQILETKLKYQRNQALHSHSASIKFDSMLTSKIESLLADHQKIITIVDGYKSSYQGKIDNLLSAFNLNSERMQSSINTYNTDSIPLINKFKECIGDVSIKWSEITTKIKDILQNYTEQFAANTVHQFIDGLVLNKISDLSSSLDSFNDEANKQLNVSIPSTLTCVNNFLNETNNKMRSFYCVLYGLLEESKINNTERINCQPTQLTNLQTYFKENIIETQKQSLISSISQLIDEKFNSIQNGVFSSYSDLIDDNTSVLTSSNQQVEHLTATITSMDKVSKDIYDSCQNFNSQIERDLNSHGDSVDSFYSTHKSAFKSINDQLLLFKENSNKDLQSLCQNTHQYLNDYSPFFINYISTTNTLLGEYSEITNECLNSMHSVVSKDNTAYKELVEKLKRRSETLHTLLNEQVGKLTQKINHLPESYRNDLLVHIPSVKSLGDTPMVASSRATLPHTITKPPSRKSMTNVFRERVAQQLQLSPTSKSTRKAFSKLENIANISSIPEYNVDDTLIDCSENEENSITDNSQIPFLEQPKKKKRVKSTFDVLDHNDTTSEKKLYKRMTE